MKNIMIILLLATAAGNTHAQDQPKQKERDPLSQLFNQLYPISENANINWKSNLVSKETILFEANPYVKFSFYNNFFERLSSNDSRKNRFAQGYYLSYTPELRMYVQNSLPVKMPSYRLMLGFQHAHRVGQNNLFCYALESGHYSNGQDGSAFSTIYPDGSHQSDSVIATINSKTNLSNMLNRTSGEFSTDLTQLTFNYQVNQVRDTEYSPHLIHSIRLGVIYYHDRLLGIFPIGGYADNLIPIYGHWRITAGYDLTLAVGPAKGYIMGIHNRLVFSERLEYIADALSNVNPLRTVTTASFLFRNGFGFFGSYIYGHDDYNIHMVDAGSQVSLGICWNMFPLFKLKSLTPNFNHAPLPQQPPSEIDDSNRIN